MTVWQYGSIKNVLSIKKFKRSRVYARFKDNIWAGDLAEREHDLLRIEVLNIYDTL